MTWNVTQVPDDPDNGHIAANDAVGEVIDGVSAFHDVDLSSGNVALTEDEHTFHLAFRCSGNAVARILTLQAVEKDALVLNEGSAALTVKLGTAEIEIGAGLVRRVYTDGTANGLIATTPAAGTGGDPDAGTIYDFGFAFEATPDAGDVLGRVRIGRDIVIPADFAGSFGGVQDNPAASWEVTVQDDGVTIGTITVSTGGVPTFAGVGSPPAEIEVAAGSEITFLADSGSPAEASVAGGSFVIQGRVA